MPRVNECTTKDFPITYKGIQTHWFKAWLQYPITPAGESKEAGWGNQIIISRQEGGRNGHHSLS